MTQILLSKADREVEATSIRAKDTLATNVLNVSVFQPATPTYRIDFFDRLAKALGDGFSVHYSPVDMGALSVSIRKPWAKLLAPMRRMAPGLEWQPGVLSAPIRRGDVVVVSGAPRNLSHMLMLVRARLAGARTIWWGHYWSSTSKVSRFRLRLMLMRLADAILFYTDHEVEEYRAGPGRRDRRPVRALNNGINVDPIIALRKPYEAGDRDSTILFIGRLTEKTELNILLQALADPRLNDVKLHIIGDGSQREELEALCRNLSLEGRVVWHGSTTDERRIADVANRCRLFAYPGGVGLSLIHAMAYGLPVVVHDDRWSHMPEIAAFYKAKCGLVFRRGDPQSLATALVEALDTAAKDRTWSDAAIRVADTDFNTREMAERFCRLALNLAG